MERLPVTSEIEVTHLASKTPMIFGNVQDLPLSKLREILPDSAWKISLYSKKHLIFSYANLPIFTRKIFMFAYVYHVKKTSGRYIHFHEKSPEIASRSFRACISRSPRALRSRSCCSSHFWFSKASSGIAWRTVISDDIRSYQAPKKCSLKSWDVV